MKRFFKFFTKRASQGLVAFVVSVSAKLFELDCTRSISQKDNT